MSSPPPLVALQTSVSISRHRPPKRLAAEMLDGDALETPQKHKKGKLSVDEGSDGDWEQWEPPALAKRTELAV